MPAARLPRKHAFRTSSSIGPRFRLTIEWERGICVVEPAPAGRAPRWSGGPQFLSRDLCQALRRILTSSDDDPAWSPRARQVLTTLRAEYAFLADEPSPFLERAGEITWWNFAGGAANVLLARILETVLGEKITSRDTSLTFKDGAGQSLAAVREAVRELQTSGGPTHAQCLKHAEGTRARGRMSKFDPCVPEALLAELVLDAVLDEEGARRALGNLAERSDSLS